MNRPSSVLICAAALALAAACAKVVPPKGGPADESAPQVDTVLPAPGPGLSGLTTVEIRFDERLEAATFMPDLYPPLEHTVSVDGSRATVELASPLDSGSVVIVLPGTLSDRRGNASERLRSFVFGADDTLPRGGLRLSLERQGGGQVSPSAVADLYSVEDSGLVRRTTPDSAGLVSLDWLARGEYRAVAYEDDDQSRLWDPDREAGADTVLSLAAETLAVSMTLTVLDTLPPSLLEAEARDRHHLFVLTSEQVDRDGFRDASFSLVDSGGRSVEVYGVWAAGGRGRPGVMLATAAMCDCRMGLSIRGWSDLMGNVRDSDSLRFWGTDSLPEDSLSVESTNPYSGEVDVAPRGPYQIAFSSWVSLDSLRDRIALTHISPDTLVPIRVSRYNGRIFEVEPERALVGEQQYRFDLDSGLVSVWGQPLAPYSWAFTPRWADVPGSISGTVSGYGAPVMLQLARAGVSGEVDYRRVAPGAYRLDSLEAGRYTVSAFADGDGDGTWDAGEAYGAHPGVVMVYPGTETERVDISILP